jgi:hypothetical protein
MRLRSILPALVAACLSTFGVMHDADACGACIAPPAENTVVTGHRMALSISPKQTVLWDQIEYAGAPGSFAWVLPVKPGAIIQLSTDAWFDTLDAATVTQVFQPQVSCNNGSDFGCGGSPTGVGGLATADSSSCLFCESEGKGGGFAPAPPPVTVVSRGSVGPYSMVTLSTDTPGALNTWLTDNGFALDPTTQPVVDAYVAEGFDFIALKLLPEKDVSAMKPVRVIQAGANPTLPLRMVAIGTGANVALTLFLISEGRWEAKNFKNTIAPTNLIAWDFKDNSSNYGEIREKALAQNDGATWLTAYAFQGALLSQLPAFTGFMGSGVRVYNTPGSPIFTSTIASAYIRQGISTGETADETCLQTMENMNIGSSEQMVTNPCPLDKPFNDPSCGFVGAGEIDSRTLICGSLEPTETRLDDVAVALNGLHPKDVWITRIEANLPRTALNDDLVVQAAASQSTVDNIKQAASAKNVEVFCGSDGSVVPPGANIDSSGPKGRENLVVLVGLGLLSLAALARRRFLVA